MIDQSTPEATEPDDVRLELTVPPTAAYVGTARAFVAAAARHFGAEEEDVADLKVAVSEACSGAIRATGEATKPFHLLVYAQPHELRVEIVTPARPPLEEPVAAVDPDLPPGQFEEAVRATLINALFPDATFDHLDGGLSVRFAVSLIPSLSEPEVE
jgi:anti-sigma regulatory factor (Ser/Thr protein kinase)